jgi:Tfp pilus assembly protein PilO
MIGDLRDVRTQLLIAVGVLLLLDLGAIAVLVSPAGRSRDARARQYEQLRLEKIQKTKAVAATQGMDNRIAIAREQEAKFNHDRLAVRYSTMSEELSQIAKQAGVTVSDVKYDQRGDKAAPPGYDEIGITIQVRGSYAQDIQFINAVERQKMLLLIDAVGFGGMDKDTLTVSVHLSTYLRSAA